jgi:GntR family transcriptional repressor for pyruvate dehydrogenase complex
MIQRMPNSRDSEAAEPAVSGARPRRKNVVELPPVERLVPTRLADDLADRIRGLIISEDYGEGQRLPSERDLAQRFGASRPTVSQALRTLSLIGLVSIKRGSGVYVLRKPEAMVTASVNLMLELDRESVGHLMELRLWLESLGVRHAASREPAMNDAEVDRLIGALTDLENASGNFAEWIAADTVFHATVVSMSGNPYLSALYESVHSSCLRYEFENWVARDSEPPWLANANAATQRALHEPIARCVIARDADGADLAVRTHHRVMMEHVEASRQMPDKPKPKPKPRARG